MDFVPRIEGSLRKRNSRGQWQQRWFVLSNTEIRYFSDQKAKLTNPKGIINMAGVLSVKAVGMTDREPYCFEVRTRERTYQLSAPSAGDCSTWITAVEACHQSHGLQSSNKSQGSSSEHGPGGARCVSSDVAVRVAPDAPALRCVVRVGLQRVGMPASADAPEVTPALEAHDVQSEPVPPVPIGRAMEAALRTMGVIGDVALTAVVPKAVAPAPVPQSHASGTQLACTILAALAHEEKSVEEEAGADVQVATLTLEVGIAYGACELPSTDFTPLVCDGEPAKWQSHLFVAARVIGDAASSGTAVASVSGAQMSAAPSSLPALGALSPLMQEAFSAALTRQLRPQQIAAHMHQTTLSSSAAAAAAAAEMAVPVASEGRAILARKASVARSRASAAGAEGYGGSEVEGGRSSAGPQESAPSLLQLYHLMDREDFDVDQLTDLQDHARPPQLRVAQSAPMLNVGGMPTPPTSSRAREASVTNEFITRMKQTDFELSGSDPLQAEAAKVQRMQAARRASARPSGATPTIEEESDEEEEEAVMRAAMKTYKGRWTDPKMFRAIRQIVSLNKRRFQEQGFDLDLTYITPRIVAMGFPSEDVEGIYRNPRKEVQAFFELRHQNHYKVYNLCGERTYEANTFCNRVATYPFEDHQAPALQMIEDMMVDVSAWLDDHPKNVVAVHCKAGKGRTGMMVCCLLYWRGYFSKMADALDFYAKMRTDDMDGVTIPSQRRYVLYFEQWLTRPGCAVACSPEGPPAMRIKYVSFNPAPKTLNMRDCYLSVIQSGGRCWRGEKLEDSRALAKVKPTFVGLGVPGRKPSLEWDLSSIGNGPLDLARGAVVRGDVRIELWSKDKRALRFWFHTAFVENGVLQLHKKEIDGPHKDRKCKHFEPEFSTTVYFDTAPTCEE